MSGAKNIESSWFKNIIYEPKVFLNTTPDSNLEKSVCDPCAGEDSRFDEDGQFSERKSHQSSSSNSKTYTIVRNKAKDKREDTDSNETMFSFDLGSNLEQIFRDETDNGDESNDLKEIEFMRTIKSADDDFECVSAPIIIRGCGEPMKTQHLILDYNPVPEEDNEYNSKKCVDFWNFLEKHEELHHLKAMPEQSDYEESDYTIPLSSTVSTKASEDIGLTPITVMTLNWLKNESIMTDSLMTKHPIPTCDPVSRKYTEYTDKKGWGKSFDKKNQNNQAKETPKSDKILDASKINIPVLGKCTSSVKSLAGKRGSKATGGQVDDLAQMMAEMHKWDLEHPKSLKPPELPPVLIDDKTLSNKSLLPLIDQNNEFNCERCLQ